MPVLATYHPAALLHRPDDSKFGTEAQWKKDVYTAVQLAKQLRGYHAHYQSTR
jgi:hypothetical protein